MIGPILVYVVADAKKLAIFVEQEGEVHIVEVALGHHRHSLETLLQIARRGAGSGQLPEQLLQDIAQHRIQFLGTR